jgi:uncharacterized HAD superfamily protein
MGFITEDSTHIVSVAGANQRIHFCIDIDNVIARTDEVMRSIISDFSRGKVCLNYDDVTTFNYHECRDCRGNQISRDDWKLIHDRFSEPDVIISLEPLPGAIEGLRQLAEHGTVHIATSRLRKARRATIDWLEKHGFPEHDLHFLRHGEKHAALKRFTAAVEDDYDQAVAFATLGETPCFLIRHPWNRDRKAVEGVAWVDGWSELTDQLIDVS